MSIKIYAPLELADTSAGLTVNGDLTIDGSSSNYLNLDISGATKGYLYSTASEVQLYGGGSYLRLTANDFIRFDKNSANSFAEAMRLDGEGRLGIGTSSPYGKLHVTSNSSGATPISQQQLILENNTATGIAILTPSTTSGYLFFGDNNDAQRGYIAYNHAADEMKFKVAGSERVFINSSGNVGIGTTSPSQKLSVSGNVEIEGGDYNGLYFTNSANTTKSLLYQHANYDALVIKDIVNNSDRFVFKNNGNLLIGTTTDSGYKLDVGGAAQVSHTLNEIVNLNTTQANGGYTTYRSSGSAKGYVGFGSTLFTGLDINNFGIRSQGGLALASGGGSTRMYINSSGNVGIGTSSPNHRVDIYSSENVPLRIHRPSNANLNSSGAWGIGFSTRGDANTSTTDTRAGIFSYYNGNLFIATSTSDVVADPDASARLTILSGGNVGIGTMSPETHLHIHGIGSSVSGYQYHLILRDDSAYGINKGSGLVFRGNYNSSGSQANFGAIRTGKANANDGNANAYLAFLYGASGTLTEGMRLDYNGNVGIGTASPGDKLTVNGDISVFGNKIYNGSASNSAGIDFSDSQVDLHGYYGIRFFASTAGIGSMTERMRIANTGNVLIGTTTDNGSELQVNGYARSSNSISEGIAYAGTGFEHWGDGGTGVNFPSDDVVSLKTASTDRLYINSSGNVGIGTTSPTAKLDVKGDGADFFLQSNDFKIARIQPRGTGADLDKGLLSLFNGITEDVRIDTSGSSWFNGGNVGIGITNPLANLHINGTYFQNAPNPGVGTNIVSSIRHGSDTNYRLDYKQIVTSGLIKHSYTVVNDGTAYADNLVLDRGNVGIGETSIDARLHITSSGAVVNQKFESNGVAAWRLGIPNGQTYFAFDNTADALTSPKVAIASTGNVLIGTTTDNGYKLQVNGDATINGHWVGLGGGSVSTNVVLGQYNLNNNVSGGSNTAIGYSALSYNTASNNTAVGRQAAYNNTTGSIVAVGYQAGYGNTTGGSNTFIGHQAFQNNTTASGNTALGLQAGRNIIGSNNTVLGAGAVLVGSGGNNLTVVGREALYNNTQSNNTAIGYKAARSNTSGSIVAVGYEAGFSNTTSVGVTAIGYSALRSSTGSDNTSVGYASLFNNTTGIRNTAVGKDALVTNSTGQDNVAIGESALRNNTSSFNTAIGHNAGDANTSGSNNIFIGKDSDGVAATDSNRTFIGNASTTSTWVGGNLLVGTTTDSGDKLRVNGTVLFENSSMELKLTDNNSTGNTANTKILFTDNGTFGTIGTIGFNGDDDLYIQNNHTGNVLISGANIGIGTTSPGYTIDVNNSSSEAIARFYRSDSATSISHLVSTGRPQTRYQYSGYQTWFVGNNLGTFGIGTNYLASTTPILNITSTGNVGIGTTNPTVGIQLGNSTLGQTKTAIFNSEGGSEVGLTIQSRTNRAKLRVADNDSNAYVVAEDGKAFFGTSSNGDSSNITVLTSGNVGIGTTSPNQKLVVSGNTSVTGVIYTNAIATYGGTSIDFRDQTATSIMYLDAPNKRVGIGTTSPSRPLHVSSAATSIIADFQYTAAAYSTIKLTNTGGNAHVSSLNSDLLLSPGGTERMRVKNNGNVLIGTTTDSGYKLDVNGAFQTNHTLNEIVNLNTTHVNGGYTAYRSSGSAKGYVGFGSALFTGLSINDFGIRSQNGLALASGGANVRLYINSSGNVGVSNTSPAYNLDVTGDINASSNYYHNGVQGYTGTFTIQQPAPLPPINVDVNGGIITNVY